MTIQTILVPVDGSEQSRHVLGAAVALGRERAAHVVALHARPDPRDSLPLLGEGISGVMIEDLMRLTEREGRERAERARALFDGFCASSGVPVIQGPPAPVGVSASWLDVAGPEDDAVARRGRLADVIVVSQSPPDEVSALTLNGALVESGRPVLVVPTTVTDFVGRRVCVAWNGNVEAARAVAAALPFLTAAEKVAVLTVAGDDVPEAVAGELVEYLAWHGVAAEDVAVPEGAQGIGEALLEACDAWGGDLLVMGAYTHSRMRQLILGGVTRHVLGNARVPLLMIH